MKTSSQGAGRVIAAVCLFTSFLASSFPLKALDRTWIGGNFDWVDGGAATNWNPNDEPDSDDRALFNSADSVNLGSNNAINGLDLSGGIDLFTNDFDLTVDGLVSVGGAGTVLNINGAAGSINADDVVINASGIIELSGGTLTMDEEVGTSLIDINAGGTLQGNGFINFLDIPGVATTVLVNDGTLTALSRGVTIFSPPPVGTLSIPPAGLSRVDLDGAGEAGVVNVNRNQTLDLSPAMADAFNGTMNLFHNSTFDSVSGWTLGAGGSIVANNGFVAGGLGFPDVPADTAFIVGGPLTQSGGTINVVDTDGTLQLDVDFTMSGGSLTNSGTVVFNGVTSITTASGYAPSDVNSQTIVNANVTINDPAGNFNWDGNGAADTTVNGTAVLTINVAQVDTGDDVFGGTLTFNDSADASVNVGATSWTAAGSIVKNGEFTTSTISGDRVNITGSVAVNSGALDMPATTLASTASVTTNALLTLGSASEFSGPTTLVGTGILRMEGTSTVLANTTVNVATFDWDGLGTGTSHTINSGVTFTINSAALDSDGDMDDPFTLAGNGSQLVVNNTNGLAQWTANGIITGNASTAGTATIGGTSRMIVAGTINVDGNTTISAPVTFNGAGLVADIDAAMTLDVSSSVTTYVSGTIDGAGTFDPGISNTVTGDFAINSDRFDFDGGTWTVESGAELTFNSAVDYEPDSVTNSFESTITLNNGAIFANVADPRVVMNGTLNMNGSGGNGAEWNGDAIDIGNDGGLLDANLNVTGDGNPNSQGRFVAPVTFKSDADVDVPANAFLNFTRLVNFDTVNAANNAEFTGAGTIAFNNTINVNEAVTLNMVGGTVDLDGNDATGEFVNVDAPLTINAATVSNFGRVNGGGGVNTFDINNSVGTGLLTVNLDNAANEWTLNGPGVMNLVNDNTESTMLAGSDVNINGTVNVTGDVRTTARLDIAGIVNINTVGEPLRLAGGSTGDPNTLLGGTISGAGTLGADTGIALHGFGTINTAIDLDGASNLFADNGTLTINGSILDVGRIGTDDADGVLNVVNPWNTNVAQFVQLEGGTIQGGTMTIDNVNAVSGFGTIASRVINNTGIRASDGTLIVETAGNDNDWDGAANDASLHAQSNSTLELRDNLTFGFTGSVSMFSGGKVFANGFALDFNPGSSLFLNSNATYESNRSTDLGGVVTTSAGPASTIKIQNNFFLTFESTSTTTLVADLRLENNNIIIEQGAVFNNGGGALIIPDGSHVVGENLADIDVLLQMDGAFRPGNSQGIGRVDLFDYQQGNTGELFVELTGTALNAFDRLVASGDVVLDGYLNIDIDEVSPGVPFVPLLGQTFNIITGNSVTGTFDYADVSGMPAGLAFHIEYLANAVQLQVVTKPFFSADFDEDGDVDLTDLAIWQANYNLNQLGDADGDNDSDGRDFLLWQRQFGSAPLVAVSTAVPEPSTAMMLMFAAAGGLVRAGARKI